MTEQPVDPNRGSPDHDVQHPDSADTDGTQSV